MKTSGIVGLALAAVWLTVAAVPQAIAQGTARGRITKPRGKVEIYAAAFNRWKGPLAGEVPVQMGDRVRTGPGSSCEVVFYNKEGGQDSVAVSENTMLEIPDIPENQDQTSWVGMFSESLGKVVCQVTRRPPAEHEASPFNVRAPTVVAGVRGTEFAVEYDHRKKRTFLGVTRGILNGLAYGGALLGLVTSNQELAVDAIRVFRYAMMARAAQQFLYENQDHVNAKYNREFHVAEATAGQVLLDGALVDATWWNKEIDWDAPGRDWQNPLVLTVGTGYAILHLRHTGWLRFESGTEFSFYRMGNALMGRLRKGKMTFHRADPTFQPLRHGPRHDVAVFMARTNGDDLKVVDFTRRGGVTMATLEMAGAGRMPTVDVLEGDVKVLSIDNP